VYIYVSVAPINCTCVLVCYAFIMRTQNGGKIWISDIHNQGFCEYEIHLRYVLELPDPGGKALVDGRAAHEVLDISNQLAAQVNALQRIEAGLVVPSTVEEIVDVARNEGESFAVRDVSIEGTRIKGRIDQVDFTPEKVFIIDDKPPSRDGKPYINEIHQVQGYCLAFSEQYPEIGLPLVAVIRNEHTGDDMWSKLFTQGDVLKVNECVNRIIGIMEGTWIPEPTTNKNKCANCRWHPVCDRSQYHGRG